MNRKFDFADSIIALERQATSQAAQGNRRGLIDAAESLKNMRNDCEAALALPDLTDSDRQWFQAKLDKASSVIV